MIQAPLHPHPATPSPHIRTFTAAAEWSAGDLLTLRYHIEGDIDALRLPPPQPSGQMHGLWRSTCFEAFLRRRGERGYVEINASPSTQWAAYGFDDYRQGMRAIATAAPPEITCRTRGDSLNAIVRIPLVPLGAAANGELDLGLSAVVQDAAGALSYWALAHPAQRADFHHPAGFVVSLRRPRARC